MRCAPNMYPAADDQSQERLSSHCHLVTSLPSSLSFALDQCTYVCICDTYLVWYNTDEASFRYAPPPRCELSLNRLHKLALSPLLHSAMIWCCTHGKEFGEQWPQVCQDGNILPTYVHTKNPLSFPGPLLGQSKQGTVATWRGRDM